jgi:hypothetical protein
MYAACIFIRLSPEAFAQRSEPDSPAEFATLAAWAEIPIREPAQHALISPLMGSGLNVFGAIRKDFLLFVVQPANRLDQFPCVNFDPHEHQYQAA